jgi:acyl carrier protein|tara:strand:- start:2937 stop:3170 length:234 start_codon:yes stop_codon:yes gene_type:complete
MEKNEIIKQLKELIEGQTEKKIESPDTNIDIDSFTMMLVITFADQSLNVKLDMDTLDFDKFKSLNDLAALILINKKN